MKKEIYLIALLIGHYFQISAQNQGSFFKIPPQEITIEAPEWANLMYSQNPNVERVIDLYDAYYRTHAFEKNIHTQNFKYWFKNIKYVVGEDDHIRIPTQNEKKEQFEAMRQQRASNQKSSATWSNIGPFNTYKNDGSLGLRPTQTNVSSIAVAPSNTDIIYCGANTGGGVFKSSDHGLTWSLVTLDYPITNANDIKIHPTDPDIVYLSNGNNLWKTTDGATTWNQIYTASGTIEQFYIHRNQPDIVFAATANGLLQSMDAGANWSNIFNARCWDIEAHAIDPDILFLSIHNPVEKRAEIFKSLDNGLNWTLKDNSWYVPTDLAHASDIGCKIGVTPADPDRIYAGLIGDSKEGDNGWIGIYYSEDGAESWVNADGIDGGPYVPGNDMNTNWYVAGYSSGYHQGWYNYDLDVSHVDPDRIWVGTIWACESANRGANIEYIRGTRSLEMHADIQDIDVVGNEIWYTSDGGINYSTDEMQSVEIRNTGVTASTYWKFSQGWNEDIWTGGRYHNGDAVYHENYGAGNTMFLGGAETATGFINPHNNRILHFSDITDKIASASLDEPSMNRPNLSLYPNQAYTLLNSSEIEYHPNYSNEMYLGNENVFYRSTNGGVQFDTLFAFAESNRVLEFDISRVDPKIIYCLVRHAGVGTIYKSEDGGFTFTATVDIPSSNRSRLDLSLNPNSIDQLWVISSNAGNGQKVYSTEDGGATWTNRTTSTLDDHKLLDVLFQAGTNGIVYIVTDFAVFYWNPIDNDWVLYSDGLPFLTRALTFQPFYRDSKLRLASDRGIWEGPFVVPSQPYAEPMIEQAFVSCIRDTVQFEDHSFLDHLNASWNWSFNPEPAYVSSNSVRNPKVVFAENGAYDVTLTITDNFGNNSSQTISEMVIVENFCDPDEVPGLALSCMENPDHANIPDLDLPGTNEFTISAWVKPNGIQNDYTGIVFNNGASAGLNFRPGNELGYHWPNGAWWWSSGLIVDTAVWSHVAMVVEPTSITVYLNGIGATHEVNIDPADIHTMKMGSYKGWGSRNYAGEMDEVCIWNRVLSQDEIRELRHLTRTGEQPFTEGLVAYYQFNLPNSVQVMDKVGIQHAVLNGQAMKTLSTAPIGGGSSDRVLVNSSGNYLFPNTESEMNFGDVVPNEEVVLSRLNILPDSLPNENAFIENYWILNNYGDPDFSPINAIRLKPFQAEPIGSPEDANLYVRSPNESLNNWMLQCSANNFIGESVLFDETCNIINEYQFLIEAKSSTTVNIEVNTFGEHFHVYPNPVKDMAHVSLGGTYANIEISLISLDGKVLSILDHKQSTDLIEFELPGPSGIYLVKIESRSGKMAVVKLIKL